MNLFFTPLAHESMGPIYRNPLYYVSKSRYLLLAPLTKFASTILPSPVRA